MPSLNFKKQFAPLVESGIKRQTIRALRKQPIKVGDDLHLFTGMRTNACRRLRPVEKCIAADRIEISERAIGKFTRAHACLNGRPISHSSLQKLAAADGFQTVPEFLDFFDQTHGLPFEGQLIKW